MLNLETHVYFKYPWFKADVGTDEIEVLRHCNYPNDLRKALYGNPRKGSIAVCSRGFVGLITSDNKINMVYPDGTKGFAWAGIHLKDGEQADMKVGDLWSSRNPTIIGHIDAME